MDYFRTELGKTLRIGKTEDDMPTVEILIDGAWAVAPTRMLGLRLSSSTRGLSPSEIKALPA